MLEREGVGGEDKRGKMLSEWFPVDARERRREGRGGREGGRGEEREEGRGGEKREKMQIFSFGVGERRKILSTVASFPTPFSLPYH